jgi:hypothetical protein
MRFSVRRGCHIAHDPDPGARSSDLAHYIDGTAFGALLYQREHFVMHASAIQIGDIAVLFCGASGAGKSTIAAAMVNAGHGQIADDMCAIDLLPDGTPVVAPDGRRHKLWQTSIDSLVMAHRRGDRLLPTLEKYIADPRGTVATSVSIGAIFELNSAEQIEITCPSTPNMVNILLTHAYIPQLVIRMRQRQLYAEMAGRLACRTKIRQLHRPFAFDRIAEQIALIRDFV